MTKTHAFIAVFLFSVLALGVTMGIASNPRVSVTNQPTTSENVNSTSTTITAAAVVETPSTTNTPVVEPLAGVVAGASVANVSTNASTNKASTTKTTPVKKKVVPAPKPKPTNKNTNTVTNTATTGVTLSVEITYYGSYDNDPAGSREISNPVLHQLAGGTGTYADPLTFASPTGMGAYAVGARIYVPSVQKYFIREDTCATSWTAPNGCGAVSHVDLYMGNPSDSKAVLSCEDSLTPDGKATIILNPPANLPYDPTPLWNQATGACMKLH